MPARPAAAGPDEKMIATHAGHVVRGARRRGGRRFDHLNAAGEGGGVVHALVVEGRNYRARCGVAVLAQYGDSSDLDGPVTGHVRAGLSGVTCGRCRKIMGS